eukprot:5625073-Pyramimonas_sp.AAC.1
MAIDMAVESRPSAEYTTCVAKDCGRLDRSGTSSAGPASSGSYFSGHPPAPSVALVADRS